MPGAGEPISVLVVDDHPALRAGLKGLLDGEPGIRYVGATAGTDGLQDVVRASGADVVVLDYALGQVSGLAACFAIKQQPDPPAVVLYSAYVDRVFEVPAAIAQADATVAKTASVGELLSVIRHAAAGDLPRTRLDPELVQAASARLLVDDLPIAGMLMGATPVARIAELLDLPAEEVRARALRILGRLQARDRRPAPAAG